MIIMSKDTTLTNEELAEICNKVIDFIGTFNLGLPQKYIIVKNLYESFIETCKKEGYTIVEIEKKVK